MVDSPHSGGSAKHWHSEVHKGAEIEITGVPRSLYEEELPMWEGKLEVEVVEQHKPSRAAELRRIRDEMLAELTDEERAALKAKHGTDKGSIAMLRLYHRRNEKENEQ